MGGRRISSHLPGDWIWMNLALVSPLMPVSLYFAYTGVDMRGILFLAFLLVFLRFGPQPRLYATMTCLALLMELVGTGFGNWTWYHTVPFPIGWSVTNPPILIGVGYAFFDVVINLSVDQMSKFQKGQTDDCL